MLAPLVLPEGFVSPAVIFPVGIHIAKEIGRAGGGEDSADVCIGAARIAIGIVSAVAMIRPQSVNGPRCFGALGWAAVPKLCLEGNF